MSRRAATLMEVLVAASILSLMFFTIWSMYRHGMRSIQSTERVLESTRGAHILFELLHRDLKRAHEVLIPSTAMTGALASPPLEPGDALMFIDLKEYAFRKKAKTLWIGGQPFRLCQFDDVSFEVASPSLVRFRITPVPSGVPADGSPAMERAGRFTLEGAAWVEHLAPGDRMFPVEDYKPTHRFCVSGWPLDY